MSVGVCIVHASACENCKAAIGKVIVGESEYEQSKVQAIVYTRVQVRVTAGDMAPMPVNEQV